jgi:hypothetical protein
MGTVYGGSGSDAASTSHRCLQPQAPRSSIASRYGEPWIVRGPGILLSVCQEPVSAYGEFSMSAVTLVRRYAWH